MHNFLREKGDATVRGLKRLGIPRSRGWSMLLRFPLCVNAMDRRLALDPQTLSISVSFESKVLDLILSGYLHAFADWVLVRGKRLRRCIAWPS